MRTEIEAKLKVASLEPLSRKLKNLGAKFLAEQVHNDSYFDDKDSNFRKNDQALRLRISTDDKGSKRCILAYKGSRDESEFKKRREIELEILDHKSLEEILDSIGYKKALTFEKKRKLWSFKDCEIALDEVPLLGYFIEIEGPDADSISKVQNELGLGELQHIRESYMELMENKLREINSKQKEVLFRSDKI